eukprot:TRINITY_DN82642_c0_g1_i1.p1 TRINITY_DN82642_c0_g1~~TRINITY_DN82642_c0_g1_i1.p1  ORF type:complete len:335 (+),score=34.31 TRINITY_DN82642_c0_g1_i1:75-1007(+)
MDCGSSSKPASELPEQEEGLPVLVDAVDVAGTSLCCVELDSLATVVDVKAAIETQTGMAARQQHLLIHGQPATDNKQTVAELMAQAGVSAANLAVTVVALPAEENWALISTGADLRGDEEWTARERAERLQKPLLRHDLAFPELCEMAWWNAPAEHAAVPSSCRKGTAFSRHLQDVEGAGWSGDEKQSFIFAGDGWDSRTNELVVSFGGGIKLSKAGFTYSPWDRNYGSACEIVVVRARDAAELEAGCIDIPTSWIDRGDPSQHDVETLMCDLNKEVRDEICKELRFRFPLSSGRRLYFLFAIGCKVSDV